MKFVINSLMLNKALRKIQPAISTNHIIPITGFILCKVEDGMCELTATNTHLTIIHQVSCESKENFQCLIPFKQLLNVTSVLASQPILINIDKTVEIKHDNGTHKCGVSEDVANFPPLPNVEMLFSMFVEDEFLEAMQLAKNFVMKKQLSEQYYYFKDCFMEIKNNSIYLTASDTEQIIRYKGECEVDGNFKLLFDPEFISACAGINNGTISGTDKFVKMQSLYTTVMCTLNTQKYPEVERIFTDHTTNFEATKEEMISALNRLTVFENDFHWIAMNFKKDKLSIRYDNNEMEEHAEEILTIKNSVPEGVIHFNAKSFKNILQATPDKGTIKFTFGSEKENVFLDTENENINLLIRPIILINKN